ncbi:MAG: hypothetical protein KDJ70_17995, partial [Candidatus Competibacteraceae bacterium]|nr:hypothetical protein [Candidatus Competibacteraceae bacterium]
MPPSAGQKGQDYRVILVGGDTSSGWTIGAGISGRFGPEYPFARLRVHFLLKLSGKYAVTLYEL